MRTRQSFVVLGAILAAMGAPFGATSAAAQTAVGENTVVENTVRTQSVGESSWRASVVGGAVLYADDIITGEDGRLEIQLRDQSTLTVSSNAALTVDRFVLDDAQPAEGVVFAVVRGVFRFVSGTRGAEREQVGFRTPTASIGIRGTVIEGVVGPEALEFVGEDEAETLDLSGDPETAAVIVLVEGEIDIEIDGERVTITEPGQAVAVSGRRISRPFARPLRMGGRFEARLPPHQPPRGPPPAGAQNGPQGGPQGGPQAPPQAGPQSAPQTAPQNGAPNNAPNSAPSGAPGAPQTGAQGGPQAAQPGSTARSPAPAQRPAAGPRTAPRSPSARPPQTQRQPSPGQAPQRGPAPPR